MDWERCFSKNFGSMEFFVVFFLARIFDAVAAISWFPVVSEKGRAALPLSRN
ncbi:hypothetical protein OOT00_09455 [Desulfobotulus sp. H1]|uniref:Transmembrane protein n=1 Tax=Desulfobotulus pelophilus TaxID=2823377 RepID=A0ABT3N9S3_9BACT|nr:hypothetical protein [Desulfobotulus pelophilus]MCW7754212.1 hypothetical protein [Desulfobotulus pelophilus]